MTDATYERNVSKLENEYRTRINRWAAYEVSKLADELDQLEDDGQLAATEAVAARLFESEAWFFVTAVDISDIAYEAVADELSARGSA